MEILLSLFMIAIIILPIWWKTKRDADEFNRQGMDTEVLKIHSKDHEMHYLRFRGPDYEGTTWFVYAKKTDYPSLNDFIVKALVLADSEEGGQEWTDFCREVGYTPVARDSKADNYWKIPHLKRWITGSDYEKKSVTVVIEPVNNVASIGPQEWNDETCVIETDIDYIVYHFHTSG